MDIMNKNSSSNSEESDQGIDSFFMDNTSKIKNRSRRAMSIDKVHTNKKRERERDSEIGFILEAKEMDFTNFQSEHGSVMRNKTPGMISNMSFSPRKKGKGNFSPSRFQGIQQNGFSSMQRKVDLDHDISRELDTSLDASKTFSRRNDIRTVKSREKNFNLDDSYLNDAESKINLEEYSNFGEDKSANNSNRSSIFKKSGMKIGHQKRSSGFSKFSKFRRNNVLEFASPEKKRKIDFFNAPIEEIDENSRENSSRKYSNDSAEKVEKKAQHHKSRFHREKKLKERNAKKKASKFFRTKTFNPTVNRSRFSKRSDGKKSKDEWDLDDFNFDKKSKGSDKKFIKILE